MQKDMHYYGTYAMARAAGLEVKDAKIIAYAAQYVDDSTCNDSEMHKDGGMFEAIATAHTNSEAIGNAISDQAEQRKVWVPFHFFPGNEGTSLSEKLICRKDSPLAREMVENHIRHAVAVKDEYGLTLMGIMAHVYADTFAHFGFSGISSSYNKVDASSFELEVQDKKAKAYIMGKLGGFFSKYTPTFLIENYRKIASNGASAVTGALGHGAVGTYPDRPLLRWRFQYSKADQPTEWRNNSEYFVDGCEKLYNAFREYGKQTGIAKDPVPFDTIKDKISQIICLEKAQGERIEAWIKAITNNSLFPSQPNEAIYYLEYEWEQQKDEFEDLENTYEMIEKEVYKFHQAAIYHRDYTLKQLLPKYKIIVL